ncbi:hypothetical protein HN682_09565, partial [Candidatus Peregrinibacteria bacterium]|nr:hypothetical protein [Candidatus Peregrinibacteria bacterium]
MKKVKVPSSTIQSLETIFDNLADAVGNNITKREERTYKNLGFIFNMENDVPSSDDWKIELTPGPLDSGKFRINVGSLGTAKGILPNGELIGISTTKDITLSDLQLS